VEIETIADSLWRALQEGRHMPAEWSGRLTLRGSYAVQLSILDRYLAEGERQAGWKVGLTAAAMRAQQRVHEPCFGFLLESGYRRSGATYRFETLIAPGFENELCLTLGKTLQGPGVTLEMAAEAVTHAAPALEIVEKRGDFAADLPLSMADNAQQKGFVTGEDLALAPETRDLGQARVAVCINGVLCEQASGAEVMGGGALLSVMWLANKLAEFGRPLEAGMRVMSRSFTRQHPLAKGDIVEASFTPFGTVVARFD
jgi:2-keto-4-pentenoate hydratase